MTGSYSISPTGFGPRAAQRARETLAAVRLILSPGGEAKFDRFILMYHRVLPGGTRLPYPIQPGMFVTAETFERHITWLKKWCDMVPLAALLDTPLESPGERSVCAITFDDGWRDTFETAYPVLRKHGVPATVFLATGFIGTSRWFWPEWFAFLVSALGSVGGEDAAGEADRRIEDLKEKSPDERERVIGELEKECREQGVTLPGERQTMTWDEVREMAAGGVEFGGHTVEHAILTGIPLADVEREVVESKRGIEAELGREVVSFCYPNGNFAPDVEETVQRAGYRFAVTTRPGVIGDDGDPLALPRIGVHEDVSRTEAQLAWRIRRAALRKQERARAGGESGS